MKGRSSSYHAFLGRATGHVRRASRNGSEFNAALLPMAGSTSGTDDASSSPSWLDFSPREHGLPQSARHPTAGKRGRAQFAPPAVLRHNKSAQRLFADARIAVVKSRARGLDRRILLGGVLLFFPIFSILYFLLQRLYGVRGFGHASVALNVESNLQRMQNGLPPKEFWPFRIRTRLRHRTPFSRPVQLQDVLDARNRAVPRGRDYRVVSKLNGSPPSVFPVRVSLIAACRDRTGFLQTALPTWLKALSHVDEVVLIDWGTNENTHVPLMAVVEAAKDKRISLVTVQNTTAWVLSHAYNLALRQARGEWVLKVDCDTMLNPRFLDFHSLPPAAQKTDSHALDDATTSQTANEDSSSLTSRNNFTESPFYYTFAREEAQQENERHLTGVLLARIEDLRTIRGYDERISTYGWDDSDLYRRLERSVTENGRGLHRKQFVAQTAVHIAHGTEFASGDQQLIGGPALELEINRLAIAALPAWESEAQQEGRVYSYKLASSDASYIFAIADARLTPALERLPLSKRESLLDEARNKLLHDIYGIPLNVLTEINRSRSELVRALDRIRSSGLWTEGTGVIFAHVSGTMPQRLFGTASAVALASEYKRPLFLAWAFSAYHPLRLSDVFDLDRAAERGVHVFQVGAWRCRGRTESCVGEDKAYAAMTDFRSREDSARPVLDILQGRGSVKQNIALRLVGQFPNIPRAWLVSALRDVQPAPLISEAVASANGLPDARGLFVGQSMRARGVDAMAKRLRTHAGDGRPYFVAGSDRAVVRSVNHALDVPFDMKIEGPLSEIADIYALARCSEVVNDGRPHRDVLDAVALVKEALFAKR